MSNILPFYQKFAQLLGKQERSINGTDSNHFHYSHAGRSRTFKMNRRKELRNK